MGTKPGYIYDPRSILLRMRNVSDKRCLENHNTHFKFNNFFLFQDYVVYEVIWKNIVLSDRTQMTIWRVRFAYCIPMATDTHLKYVILIAFHYNNGHTNAPQCYVKRTLPVLVCSLTAITADHISSRFLLLSNTWWQGPNSSTYVHQFKNPSFDKSREHHRLGVLNRYKRNKSHSTFVQR